MGETVKPAIICFTSAGEEIAHRIADLTGGPLYRCGSGHADARDVLATLFKADIPIIGICASGILVRLLAAHLSDKTQEPPVIAVSANGHHVVPLLGGHRGANRLARSLADELHGIAAITTASDSRFAFALDEPPMGYVIADRTAAKPAMAAVLDGDELRVKGGGAFLAEAGYAISEFGTVSVEITERAVEEGLLAYHPKTLVAGVGCARGTNAEDIVTLVRRTLEEAGLSEKSLAALASIDLKADEAGLNQAAAQLGVPLCLFTAEQLAAESDRLPNPSEVVLAEVGTPGVAEAAALKAGTLLVEKQKTASATCAIGRSAKPLDTEKFGRSRGELHLVGIGPGEAIQRTASAIAALEQTSDWVGYGLYLDLIGDLKTDQKEHRFGLGDEEPRVRHALELAASGKRVALVCSGDAQIYAMAALAYELLEAEGIAGDLRCGAARGAREPSRHFGFPDGFGPRRSADRARFLLHLALRPVDPARRHLEAPAGGSRGRFRHRALQSPLAAPHRTDRGGQGYVPAAPAGGNACHRRQQSRSARGEGRGADPGRVRSGKDRHADDRPDRLVAVAGIQAWRWTEHCLYATRL